MWSEMSSKSSHHFHSPFDGDIYLGGSDTAVLMGKALENDPLLQEARSALDPLNSAEGMPAGCAKFSWRMPGLQSLWVSGLRASGLQCQNFAAVRIWVLQGSSRGFWCCSFCNGAGFKQDGGQHAFP